MNIQTNNNFYKTIKTILQIRSTLWIELSWSHYKLLIRVKNESARAWYMKEAVKSNWSVRALDRQIGTHYYERLISSQYQESVMMEAKENTVVKYSVIDDNENLFISKYQLYLPTQEELKAEIERDLLELEL